LAVNLKICWEIRENYIKKSIIICAVTNYLLGCKRKEVEINNTCDTYCSDNGVVSHRYHHCSGYGGCIRTAATIVVGTVVVSVPLPPL
jgi:hypothetical protein